MIMELGDGLLERDEGGGLADDESCCCVSEQVCCPNQQLGRRWKSLLDATNCSALEGVEIPLTYGTLFCGTIDAPEGVQTPPGWETGVIGWEGEAGTGGCGTVKQRVWCFNGNWHSVIYLDGEPVSGYLTTTGTCCPFRLSVTHGISSLVTDCCEGPISQVNSTITECQ